MKNLLETIFLGLLLVVIVGPDVSIASEPTPTVRAVKAETVDAELYEREIVEYEKAMGKDHGLTPDQIHVKMQSLMADPVFQNRFLGISTLQTPSDAWIILEIMFEVKPDLIVEAGTYHGGSAALWAIMLEHINPRGRVLTIDIEDQREPRAVKLPISKRRVDFLLGSSTDPKIVREVRRRAKGKRVLVLLDSLHSKEHVAAELEAYTPIVPVGSYLIVQDTLVGPAQAIKDFLAANDEFIADRGRERYKDTNTVNGYLKRVKR
jgi:cephalosporin hydroxylase